MTMLMVTVFRELAVASIRLITAKKSGVVVAADNLGKIKTVVQIICIELAVVEPLAYDFVFSGILPDVLTQGLYVLTLVAAALAILFTVLSGMNYILTYWKYMDPEK